MKSSKLLNRLVGHAKKLVFFVPVALAVWLFTAMVGDRNEPERKAAVEVARPMRIIEVRMRDVTPRVLAYGDTRPGRVWRAVARVGGDVVHVDEHLKNGGQLPEGQVVLRLDDTQSRNELARLEAQLAQTRAQIRELEQQKTNEEAELAIEQEALAVASASLERSKSLRQRDAGSKRQVEEQTRSFLSQKQTVQRLQSSIDLAPSRIAALEASAKATKAQIETAKLNIEYATISTPFDCVVPVANIQVGQVVSQGEQLFEANGIAVAEIDAQLTYSMALTLLTPEMTALIEEDIRLSNRIEQEQWDELLTVKVRQYSGASVFEWPGSIVGTTQLADAQTRTLGFVIEVEEPFKNAVPGVRPPLVEGTYCEVEVRSNPLRQQVIVPRSAVRDGVVHVLDGEERLRRRKVEVAFTQDGFSVVSDGLAPNDRVVISDPTPAIEGQLVAPVLDEDVEARLDAGARAETRAR